ncbi:prolipoprotein diacylglyceryl transferase [Haloactinospora alba]|uniref:Phosphatidylglycerol--prolipoprotein diacylglyceryl transferase n=1 Tax=Haloactinospora alba TaxID=405555 RepID=A0A543NI11_9ACTN|nr:prolipoprotein diacylglyceryl transferase [Haloactinospora alba]TQN31459.1 prolipoprotein diacylglyceryl transferase [Haloactinospora alba]
MTIPTSGTATRTLAVIPSPEVSSFQLGPLTIHLYALCILAGVIVAVYWSERRWAAMGGEKGTIMDLAVPAVLLGLVGGRLYHVISDYQYYFGPGEEPIRALFIWEGGLGIWGAVPLGVLGVWWFARRRGLSMAQLSFAIAPALPLAQAFGRWGNYFNQELFGRPTDLPWALEVTPHPSGAPRAGMVIGESTYHPTFLYESLWCLGLAVVLLWLGRRYPRQLAGGRLFAVYVMGYAVGRFWIEYLRVDPAHVIFGLRLNNWTSLLVLLGAIVYFVWAGRRLKPLLVKGPQVEREPDAPSPDTRGNKGSSPYADEEQRTGETSASGEEPGTERSDEP